MSTLRVPAGPTGPAAGEVVEVRDGDAVAAPQIRAEFDAAALGPPREVPGPIALEQPLGRGFEVDGHRVRWQKWSFHVRVEPKARPRRDLVLRWTAVVGNYDYVFDWSFRQDGSIGVAVGSTGVVNTKAVRSVRRPGPEPAPPRRRTPTAASWTSGSWR
jgi:Cu2+-containing amine oxidase